MTELMIDLQKGSAPLYEKIYKSIRNEIVDGKISKGEKLPSTRLLAKNLMVSRSTVELAYEQLLAEGYIEAKPCSGYFVCQIEQLYQIGQKRECSDFSVEKEIGRTKKIDIDFSPYAIDTQNFPYNVWRKLYKNVLLDDCEEILLAGDGQGDWKLRCAIAEYLHQARGVNCTPAQIIIGAGNEYLQILLMQILGTGKTVLMENPTYLQAYRTFCNMGYSVKTVCHTHCGMSIEKVRQKNPDLLYVMPSHQFPLGTVMPMKVRLELLKWAAEQSNRYLIEDDHDSEYRYKGKPIPALQGMDQNEKVIYLGTFSKSIAPSLRISYLVLPKHLLKQYEKVCGFYSSTVSKIQQDVLCEFIRSGSFGRHLNRMRAIYKNRHDFLVSELKKRTWVKKIAGDNAGLHVLVCVNSNLTEQQICEKAAGQGIFLMGLSHHYIDMPCEQEPILLLGFGKTKEEKISEGLRRLDKIIMGENI